MIRSDFHLYEFQRVAVAFPVVPSYAVGKRLGLALQIATVQVASMACLVPPGTFEQSGTVSRICVVVLIFSAELHPDVVSQ